MKASTRQVDGVTVVDLSGRITLGEGSVVLRDTVREFARQERCRAAKHNLSAELREEKNVRTRHPAMRDVTDNRDTQVFQAPTPIHDRQGIEQRLSGVFVRAVTRVHKRNGQIPRQEMWSASR